MEEPQKSIDPDKSYINTNYGKVEVFFRDYLIYKKSYRSKKERKKIMKYYTTVFQGFHYKLSFHVTYTTWNQR